jgi:hemerythrin-like domain-containing protein
MQRPDLFTPVHKAIRLMLYETSRNLQRLDASDSKAVNKTVSDLKQLLAMMESHGTHEDNLIFPAIEKFGNGTINKLEEQHIALNSLSESLADITNKLSHPIDSINCQLLCQQLNSFFNEYLALQIRHMNEEERYALPLTLEHLEDNELLSIRGQIQKSFPPEEYRVWIAWFMKALSLDEIAGILKGTKIGAPATVFENTMNTAKENLSAGEWDALMRKANL